MEQDKDLYDEVIFLRWAVVILLTIEFGFLCGAVYTNLNNSESKVVADFCLVHGVIPNAEQVNVFVDANSFPCKEGSVFRLGGITKL